MYIELILTADHYSAMFFFIRLGRLGLNMFSSVFNIDADFFCHESVIVYIYRVLLSVWWNNEIEVNTFLFNPVSL